MTSSSQDSNGSDRTALKNSLGAARLLLDHGANTDGVDLSWMDDQEDA